MPACRLASEDDLRLNLWPNPVENVLHISRESASGFEDIEVYDAIGNKVMLVSGKDDVRSMDIDVSNLQPGLYFVTIENRGIMQNTSFVKL